MAGNPNCRSKKHRMHICALKAEGFDKKNPAKFQALVERPQQKCGNCGAQAKKSENLCKPVKL
jgi:hypothetical protein